MSGSLGYASIATPFGDYRLCIAAGENGILHSQFCSDEKVLLMALRRDGTRLDRRDELAREAASQARAYFARRLERFNLPLTLDGTSIERDAWLAISRLETGVLVSYADVARAIGRPRSHRAVAGAMSRTPLDLFIPAHRVLGADGTIKGDHAQTGMRGLLLTHEGYRISKAGRVIAAHEARTLR